MLAVIETGGKQYLVKEGDIIEIEKILSESPKFDFQQIVLLVDEQNNVVKIGEPYLKEGSVQGEILGDIKGKKLYVERYKAKVRYHKRKGHRQNFTRVQIKKISL